MTRKSPITEQGGFTLLELLIAALVGGLVMTAVYSVFSTAVRTEQSTRRVLEPLRSARYAFTVLDRDVRNMDPQCLPQDIRCKDESCTFPVLDRSGKRHWVEFTARNGQLEKISRPDFGGVPHREKVLGTQILCRKLFKAVFETSPRGQNTLPEDSMDKRRSLPGMISLQLFFDESGSERNTYRSSVFLEIAPEPLNSP